MASNEQGRGNTRLPVRLLQHVRQGIVFDELRDALGKSDVPPRHYLVKHRRLRRGLATDHALRHLPAEELHDVTRLLAVLLLPLQRGLACAVKRRPMAGRAIDMRDGVGEARLELQEQPRPVPLHPASREVEEGPAAVVAPVQVDAAGLQQLRDLPPSERCRNSSRPLSLPDPTTSIYYSLTLGPSSLRPRPANRRRRRLRDARL